MLYIKPLTGSLGPKQTKCEITDETVHVDFDDYIATVTTTQTPKVPSFWRWRCALFGLVQWVHEWLWLVRWNRRRSFFKCVDFIFHFSHVLLMILPRHHRKICYRWPESISLGFGKGYATIYSRTPIWIPIGRDQSSCHRYDYSSSRNYRYEWSAIRFTNG